ncbi:MAG: hypothetical protein ACPG47_02000 [Leucothrix sp.]
MQILYRTTLLFFLATFLTACGGGGGDDNTPPTPTVTIHNTILTVNGKPVQGAKFSSTGGAQDTSGTTTAAGSISYTDNSTVEIRIGDTIIGTVSAANLASGLTMESLIAAYTGNDPVIQDLAAILADGDTASSSHITLPTDFASLSPLQDAEVTVNGKPLANLRYTTVAVANPSVSRNIITSDAFTDEAGNIEFDPQTTITFKIGSTVIGTREGSSIPAGSTVTLESLIAAYTGSDPVIQDLAAILADSDDPATPQVTLPATFAALNPVKQALITVNGKPASNVHYMTTAAPNTTATRSIITSNAFSDTSGSFSFDPLTNITFKIGSAVIGTLSGSAIPAGSTVTLESLIAANTAAQSNPSLYNLPTLLEVSQGAPSSITHYQLPSTLAELDPVAKTVLTLGRNPISGVEFTSGSNTQAGQLTNQNGVFAQDASNSVTFKVAGLVIGTATDADLPTSIEALVAANTTGNPVIKNLAALLTELNATGASNPTAGFRLYDLEQQLFKPTSLPANRVLGMNLETPQAEADAIFQPLLTVDIFRVARPFTETSCQAITYNDGWPESIPAACANADTANQESKYAFTRILRYSQSDSFHTGRYTVLYDGVGTIHFSAMGCNRQVVSNVAGLHYIDLIPGASCPNVDTTVSSTNNPQNSRGLEVSITHIDSNDPIRNIRIVMPGGICKGSPFTHVDSADDCGDTPFIEFAEVLKANRNAIVFNPDYLNFSKDFRVLRMMNLMEASPRRPEGYGSKTPCPLPDNPSPADTTDYNECVTQPLTWAERPTLDQPSWGGSHLTSVRKRQGVPLEVGIALANLLGAHPWLNIPFNADDNYIEKYATLLANELDDSLIAHIEYTNEVWNSGFWGHNYMSLKGAADSDISAMANFPVNYQPTQYSLRTRYYAKRATQIFEKFEAEFPDGARLKRILGGQNKYPTLIRHMLSYGTTVNHTDAVAIAPYFHGCWTRSGNCANTAVIPKTLDEANSVDDIFEVMDLPYDMSKVDALRGDPDSLDGTIKLLALQKAELDLVTSHEIELYAYEGGQHLTVKNPGNYAVAVRNGLQDFVYAANRDPRMKANYIKLLNGWKDAGGKLFALFTAPQTFNIYGSFGIKEHLNSPLDTSPKYDGVLTFQDALMGCWPGYVEEGC